MIRAPTWLALLAVSCAAPTVDLERRPCDAEGECLPGYRCDLGICVPEGIGSCELGRLDSCGSCEQDCRDDIEHATAVCRATGSDGYDCDYDGACDPNFHDADGVRNNGCECTASPEVCDGVDNNCNTQIDDGVPACQCSAGVASTESCDGVDNDCDQAVDEDFACTGSDIRDCDAGPGAGSGTEACDPATCAWDGTCVLKDEHPPGPVTVTASAGDGTVHLAWTYPSDSDLSLCTVRRAVGLPPAAHDDGTLVLDINSPSPGAADTHTDSDVSNGTLYHYAIFCRDASGNWQTAATSDSAQPTAVAPSNPDDISVTEGDGTVAVSFTTPATTFSACVLVRKEGSEPADHEDGTTLPGTFTTPSSAETVNDNSVSNSTTYFFAVFCHTDGTWNDNAILDENLVSATPRAPSDCLDSDTVTITETAHQCGHYANGAGNALMMALTLSTDCANTLTELTLQRHPASTVTTELSSVHLVADTNGSGTVDAGEPTLDSVSGASATVTFTGLSETLSTSTPLNLLVTADVNLPDRGPEFVAWSLQTGGVLLADDDQAVFIAGGEPLLSGAHTLASGRCDGGSGTATDLGVGTFGSGSITGLRGTVGGWDSGAGSENGWTTVGADFAYATTDCFLNTAGSPTYVFASDRGNISVILHIDSGIPLGLPLCGLEMRVYGTELVPDTGACDLGQLSNFSSLYLYYYTSDIAVAGEIRPDVVATPGPAVSLNSCNSHYADFDLAGLYSNASSSGGVDPFNVRAIFEEGGGINDDNTLNTAVPELYFRISP